MKRQISLLILLIFLGGAIQAQQLTQQFTFSSNDVQTVQSGGFDVVGLPDDSYLQGEEHAGRPQLPLIQFKLLLPQGASASDVILTINSEQQLPGSFYLYPVQLPVYPNFSDQPDFVGPDTAIYNSNNPFPGNYVIEYVTSGFRDYNYVTVSFTPFRYIPLSRQLHLLTNVTITVGYTINGVPETHKLRPYGNVDEIAYEFIKSAMINPLQTDAYYPDAAAKINQYRAAKGSGNGNRGFEPTELPALEGSPVHYVIITNNTDVFGNAVGNFTEKFQEFADWKTQSGSSAKVITVDAIRQAYPGVDIAEQIREFIKDAHKLWGTEYVLLGGNAPIVPVRWIPNMPTDLYYSAIWHATNGYDDNWNGNGNTVFGEALTSEGCDFTPDIAVGRAPVDADEEVDLFLIKNFTYARCSLAPSVPDGTWLNKQLNFSGAAFAYKTVNGNLVPRIWGVDAIGMYPTWHITEEFSDEMEQYTMHEYMDNWHTTHPSWCPAYYPTDPDGCSASNIPINDEYVEHNAVVYQLNQRYGIINHVDHSGPFGLGLCAVTETTYGLGASDFQNLVETNKYPVFLSGGCHTIPIERNFYIGEQWINAPYGGVNFIGASTDFGATSSFDYNYQFFSSLYNDNVHTIGWTNYFTSSNLVTSAIYLYKILQLLGDPELSIYDDVPVNMTVTYNSSINNGNSDFNVAVTGFPTGEKVKICLYKENEICATTETETGTATFNITPDTPGNMLLTVTCHNAEPYEAAIGVTQTNGVHLYKTNVTVIDENSNGFIEPGETIDLSIELTNSGSANASGISGILVPGDANTVVTQNTSGYPNIQSGQAGNSLVHYVFTTSLLETYHGKAIPFELEIYTAQGNFTEPFYLNIETSKLETGDRTVLVNDVETNTFNQGDAAELFIDIHNYGIVTASNLTAVLSTNLTSNIVVVDDGTQNYGDIESFTKVTNTNAFTFDIGQDYNGEALLFELTITDDFDKTDVFELNFTEAFPALITGFDFSSGKEDITITWQKVNNIKGYNIYRCGTQTGNFEKINNFIVSGTSMYFDAEVEELTEYWYKISVISPTGNELYVDELQAYQAWTSLESHGGFPIAADNSAATANRASVTVSDIDGDATEELFPAFINGKDGKIMGFYETGQELFNIDGNETTVSGFAEVMLPEINGSTDGGEFWSEAAVGDVDNDGNAEVFVTTSGNYYAYNRGYLFGFRTIDEQEPINQPDPLWNGTPIDLGWRSSASPVLADLNGDGLMEIITLPETQKIRVHNSTGNLVWERQIGTTDYANYGLFAVADLDNNGKKEIILGTHTPGEIYILNFDGSDFNGVNPIYTSQNERFDSNPVIANIDDDDVPEIIIAGRTNDSSGNLYAFNIDGSFVTGNWDGQISLSYFGNPESEIHTIQAAVGDINNDGNLEIAIADKDKIYVFDNVGTTLTGFPIDIVSLNTARRSPILADVDSDEDIEIIVTASDNRIYAFNPDGTECIGWRLKSKSSTGFAGTPTISDIDGDGFNEIIISNNVCETYIWKTTGDANKVEWGSYRADAQNTGEYKPKCKFSENYTIEITEANIVWNGVKHIQGHLIINEGSDLTIHSKVTLMDESRIIIKPGGKLILDGGTLTNACGDTWQGIEVWGNPSLSQTSTNQGTLEIINGGTIENATVAVRLGSKDYTNKGGGIIFAADAVFRNNNTGVKFETYSSGNFSYFDRCTFETTAGLPDNQTPQYFVMMTSVDGIDIKGCTFQNTLPDSVAYADRGIGIYSVNSVFTVDKVCISGTTPCTEYRYPEFNNLNYAIKALATSSNTPCYISEGQFNYNRRGVYLSGISSATFTNNMFDMSVTQINSVANDTIYGSYFDGCTGYTFHENQYISNYTQVPGKIALGLIINNSGPDNNLVYDNYFENVFTSTLIQGENRNNGGSTGLVIKCNQFVNTLYDIVVTYPGLFSTPYMGIALHQGANTLNNPDMAGNLFYYNLISNDYDDINNKANLFYYYYPTNTIETRLKPKDYTKNKVTLMPKSNTLSWTRENGCPEATNPGGGESESLLLQMNEAAQQIDSTQNILSLLIDAGDTESLQYEVETSTSSSSMQVYNELMNTSPYLSDTVVSTAIEKEDVLPNAMLRDVMVANPNTAKSDELLSKLDSRWEPMPDYMKAQILQGRSIVSLREETEANLSAYRLKKSLAFYQLINYYLAQPDLDSLSLLFASDKTMSSKYRLAFLYLDKGDVTAGAGILNSIPSQFELTSEELTSHEAIVDYYDLLAANPQGMITPDSTQLAKISNISSTGTGNASVYARNLLLAMDQTTYNEPILLPDLYKSAESIETYENLLNTGQPPLFKVYPNPSKDYVIIEFLTTNSENTMLEINDANGWSIKNIQLQSNRDQLVVDTHNWKPGIYFIVLKTESKTIESLKLSIIR